MQSSQGLIVWAESRQVFHPVQPADSTPTTKTLVVIDPTLPNYLPFVHSADAATEVLVLVPYNDGVEQITDYLTRLTHPSASLESLKIITPSYPGKIKLGSVWLDRSSLETYSDSLQTWCAALMPNAKILLHGGDIVKGTEGMAFLGRLSQLTERLVEALDQRVANQELESGSLGVMVD